MVKLSEGRLFRSFIDIIKSIRKCKFQILSLKDLREYSSDYSVQPSPFKLLHLFIDNLIFNVRANRTLNRRFEGSSTECNICDNKLIDDNVL